MDNFCGADLRSAPFRGRALCRYTFEHCDFRGADLRNTNFDRATIRHCDFRGADLRGACFLFATLENCRFHDADLRGANLRALCLHSCSLIGADLNNTSLPAPATVLQAWWGQRSKPLTLALMRWDMDNHPNPQQFRRWAYKTGSCPYRNCVVQRAARFSESPHRREKWWNARPMRPYDLMRAVLHEAGCWTEA